MNYYLAFGRFSMSKIGNIPVRIPPAVQLQISKDTITIKGPEGEVQFKIPKVLRLMQEADRFLVKTHAEEKKVKSIHGFYRQLIFNAIKGVVTPWQKKLEVLGTGYNVKLQGEDLIFKIGFSHVVIFKKEPQIEFKVEGDNKVVVMGPDKQLVGQVAYQIRMLKPPDAYKGKGIRYEGEKVKLKPGKKVKATTGATV